MGVCLSLHFSLSRIPQTLECKANAHTHSKRRHRAKSVRYLLHVEKAWVNFLWQQKEASVCTAFNNELKCNSGHVTQMKAEMPSVVFFFLYFMRFIWHCWHILLKKNVDWFVWGLTKYDVFDSVPDVIRATGKSEIWDETVRLYYRQAQASYFTYR